MELHNNLKGYMLLCLVYITIWLCDYAHVIQPHRLRPGFCLTLVLILCLTPPAQRD